MNFDVLNTDTFNKVVVPSADLHASLTFLKNNAQFMFDRLNTIIAVDLGLNVGKFELIYDLHSIETDNSGRISVLIDRNSPSVASVVDIYKSAYFDECEIYDMFGISFNNNPNLKRLYMPKGWKGHPLRKDYEQNDKRLSWNE